MNDLDKPFRLDILKKDNKFFLAVNNEWVFEADKLSDIVRKIEAYSKMRFLPEPTKLSFMERVKGVVGNGK